MGVAVLNLLMLQIYINSNRKISVNNMEKTGLNGSPCKFFADYRNFDKSNIINIYAYLMKKSII